jgi:hypothetical protein
MRAELDGVTWKRLRKLFLACAMNTVLFARVGLWGSNLNYT